MMIERSHEYFMKLALLEAQKAFDKNEIPVGAVVVANGEVISRGYNQVETLKDPTAHAEMIAITSACNNFGSKILSDCTLYVTLEPCFMCAGAVVNAQLKNVVYATPDRNRTRNEKYIHDFKTKRITSGVMAPEAADLLDQFFDRLRMQE